MLELGDEPFYGTKIQYIYLPKNIGTLYKANSFDSLQTLMQIDVDEENNNYCSIDGVLFSRNMSFLIHFPASKNQSFYTIPNTVTQVLYGGFCYLKYLKYLVVPESVKSFQTACFSNCEVLSNITAFRKYNQGKLIFRDATFSNTIFQQDNITYIYSNEYIKTCNNICVYHNLNFAKDVFILMYLS